MSRSPGRASGSSRFHRVGARPATSARPGTRLLLMDKREHRLAGCSSSGCAEKYTGLRRIPQAHGESQSRSQSTSATVPDVHEPPPDVRSGRRLAPGRVCWRTSTRTSDGVSC
jgi:hypothetical protein